MLILLAALVTFAGALALTDVSDAYRSDVGLYARYGEAIVGGAVPYRDLPIEYPPGSLLIIVPPAVVADDPVAFGDLFVAAAVALLVATIVVTWFSLVRLGARGASLGVRLLPLALAPALLGSVAVQRLDPLPAFIVALATMAAVFDAIGVASLLAGIATATKLYPAVLVPGLLVRARRLGGRRGVCGAALSFLVGVGVFVVPFVVVGATNGMADTLRYHFDRPLQIESVGSSAALLLHVLVGFDVGMTTEFGSVNLGGSRGQAIEVAQQLLLLATISWVLFRTATIASTRAGLVLAVVSSVTAFIAFGKVLSPQYIVWLLPLIPLVAGRTGLIATAVLLLVGVLTRIWYEDLYVPVTRGGLDPGGIVLLAARNSILLLLLGLLLVEVEREVRRSRNRAAGSAHASTRLQKATVLGDEPTARPPDRNAHCERARSEPDNTMRGR